MYEKVHRMYKKVHATITVCLINNAAYDYTDIDLDTEQVLLSNQLGHACSKITKIMQKKVHFFCTQRTYIPVKLPGYGLGLGELLYI